MKRISIAVFVAVLVAGLMQGCATTGPTTSAGPGGSQQELVYLPNQGALGLKAQDDPEFALVNPFRIAAFVLHPFFLFGQRVAEIPYALAVRLDPDLFGLSEAETKYLMDRWNVKPGLIKELASEMPGPRK